MRSLACAFLVRGCLACVGQQSRLRCHPPEEAFLNAKTVPNIFDCGGSYFYFRRLYGWAVHPVAAQKKHAASPESWLRGVSDGSTRVVDMTYAINDKLPAWPGDDRTFEAKAVATPGKDGYFARSFWTLEHCSTPRMLPRIFHRASNISIKFLWRIFSVRRS